MNSFSFNLFVLLNNFYKSYHQETLNKAEKFIDD